MGSGRLSRQPIFFLAEDGIRARNVTGVQTCALPISHVILKVACDRRIWPPRRSTSSQPAIVRARFFVAVAPLNDMGRSPAGKRPLRFGHSSFGIRSEERREGKGGERGVRRILRTKC